MNFTLAIDILSILACNLLLIKINKNFRNFRLTDSNIFDIYTFVYYILYVTIYFIFATILQYCNKIDKNKYFTKVNRSIFQEIQSIETWNKNITKHPIKLQHYYKIRTNSKNPLPS